MQSKLMDKKNLLQKMKMSIAELEEYHRKQRSISYEKNEPIKGIRWRQKIHFLLILGLGLSRHISGEKLCIVRDEHINTGKPLIYAATHIGWHDAEITFAAIKSHAYALWGDPRELYKRIEMLLLSLNGTVCCDSAYRDDCRIAKETCIRLLRQGGSLLIFPEGAWNIIENQVVMPLFPGAAEIAIRSECEIVPVALEHYDKHYYVNIGKNIDLCRYKLSQKKEASEHLRDTLCTLKWEIWERYGKTLRKNIPEGYSEMFLAQYEAQTDEAYTIEDICNTRYHSRIASPEEVFNFVFDLKPCRENAFLFRGNMRNTE